MVDRREIDNFQPCTVIDLDGTYVDGNTLKIYLGCGVRFLMSRGKIPPIARLLKAILRRKLGKCDHRRMKETILSTLYPYPQILPTFCKKVKSRINPDIKSLIKRNSSNGHRILLATAAPEFYVRSFWTGDLVATDFQPDKPLKECVREEKVLQVTKWLEANNCKLDTVVTDSIDDIGLVKENISGANILVKPSASDLRAFRELKPAHLLLVE